MILGLHPTAIVISELTPDGIVETVTPFPSRKLTQADMDALIRYANDPPAPLVVCPGEDPASLLADGWTPVEHASGEAVWVKRDGTLTPEAMGFRPIGGGVYEHRFGSITLERLPEGWEAWHDWPPFVRGNGNTAEAAARALVAALRGRGEARCRRLSRRLVRAFGLAA